MKKIIVLLILMVGVGATSFAQNRKAEWATIKTPNLKCWECKHRVENYMAREIA